MALHLTATALSFADFAGPTRGSQSNELLDDYEEGTWTPTMNVGTSRFDATLSISAYYVKVGSLVSATGHLSSLTKTGNTGDVSVHGFPFDFTNYAAVSSWPYDGITTTHAFIMRTDSTGDGVVFQGINSSGVGYSLDQGDVSTGLNFMFSLQYFM